MLSIIDGLRTCKAIITQDTGVRGSKLNIPMKKNADMAMQQTVAAIIPAPVVQIGETGRVLADFVVEIGPVVRPVGIAGMRGEGPFHVRLGPGGLARFHLAEGQHLQRRLAPVELVHVVLRERGHAQARVPPAAAGGPGAAGGRRRGAAGRSACGASLRARCGMRSL